MLKLYNTFTREIEDFKPIKEKSVGLYSCGPTVYWYQHIGNLRTYVFADILKRVLESKHLKVKHIINVTDVGHLTSDADTGEDKMERAAAKEGKTAKQISKFYLKAFQDDFQKLNIRKPNIWAKATEHIKEQIVLIKKLEEKGFTYKTSDGIYFDTSKIKDYGKMARLNKEGLEAGKRIELKEKKNITDFALWKFSEQPGQRQQEWKSPWGVGFPGWHIECSAMSMKYLGKNFDIHTGGEDHISIHHTNEIAQSEAATGKKFVNFWLHGAFLNYRGEKVSKSKGGLFTIAELEQKGFLPLAFRYLCLTAHYRSPLEFSLESLENAKLSYVRLKNIIGENRDDKKVNTKYLEDFNRAISEDLDMPKALAILWNLVRDRGAQGKIKTIKEMDKVLGLDLLKKTKIKISSEVSKLVAEREIAREKKDFTRADELRQKIESLGFSVKDTEDGAEVKIKT